MVVEEVDADIGEDEGEDGDGDAGEVEIEPEGANVSEFRFVMTGQAARCSPRVWYLTSRRYPYHHNAAHLPVRC